jgi:hypothetical protein
MPNFRLTTDEATALAAYGSSDWRPSDPSHVAADLSVEDRKRETTRHIATTLNLTPLTYTEAEFKMLQNEYKPLLKFKFCAENVKSTMPVAYETTDQLDV